MAASLWLLPSPPLPHHACPSSSPPPRHVHQQLLFKKQQKPRPWPLLRSSSPTTSSSLVTREQEAAAMAPPPPQEAEAAAAAETAVLSYRDDPNFRGCRACGKGEIERGCNGEGRMQGGIATVPGFGWWPIKAYRPCPGFVAAGGRYRRQGQSMDDVAAGRARKASSKQSQSKKQPNTTSLKG